MARVLNAMQLQRATIDAAAAAAAAMHMASSRSTAGMWPGALPTHLPREEEALLAHVHAAHPHPHAHA